MGDYNVKLTHYIDGSTQTRLYSHLNLCGKKEKVNVREYVSNPFDGKMCEVVTDFEELDRREKRAKAVSRNRTIQKIYNYSRGNIWDCFLTLTFDPKKVDRYDYSVCVKKLSQWLKNLKKVYPNMVYVVVPEQHKDGAWHFHGLFSGINDCLIPSGHCDKTGRMIYNVGKYKFGFSTATFVDNQEAVCKYLTKYITKDLCEVTKGRKRYWVSRNCQLPPEETFVLDFSEQSQLYYELLEENPVVKIVECESGLDKRMITYIETDYYTIKNNSDNRGFVALDPCSLK